MVGAWRLQLLSQSAVVLCRWRTPGDAGPGISRQQSPGEAGGPSTPLVMFRCKKARPSPSCQEARGGEGTRDGSTEDTTSLAENKRNQLDPLNKQGISWQDLGAPRELVGRLHDKLVSPEHETRKAKGIVPPGLQRGADACVQHPTPQLLLSVQGGGDTPKGSVGAAGQSPQGPAGSPPKGLPQVPLARAALGIPLHCIFPLAFASGSPWDPRSRSRSAKTKPCPRGVRTVPSAPTVLSQRPGPVWPLRERASAGVVCGCLTRHGDSPLLCLAAARLAAREKQGRHRKPGQVRIASGLLSQCLAPEARAGQCHFRVTGPGSRPGSRASVSLPGELSGVSPIGWTFQER